jgi:cAMP-binding proteins - catabolite gene activator and regulatory subunit of cAMP-dependent protein kinases
VQLTQIPNRTLPDKDEVIHRKNDTKNLSFFIIGNCTIKVFSSGIDGTEVSLAILNKGEFWGEISLVDGEPCSASVKAVQKSELFAISIDDFLTELKRSSTLMMTLLWAL